MAKRIQTFREDALGSLDALGVADRIARREASVRDVVESAIERAEMADVHLNALVLKTYDRALSVHPERGVGGPFYGVPAVIKDNDHVEGLPTQFGTGAFRARPARRNSSFVQRFFSAGVRSIGKSTLPEFGLICSTENERWAVTRNPWHIDHTTGGSSSGSAALVASGVVPIATANDGAGSIRIPASICGLVGLKPTRGRLPSMDGTDLMPVRIVHQGVLTRSVRDTAAFMHAADRSSQAKNLEPLPRVQRPGTARLRIAVIENQPAGTIGHQDDEVRASQRETARLLESLGHHVEEVPMPIDPDRMVEHFLDYYGLMAFLTSRLGRVTVGGPVDRSQLEPFTTGLSKRFGRRPLSLPRTVRAMRRLATEATDAFADFDVVMSPVLAHITPPIGHFSPALPFEEVSRRAVEFAAYCGLHNVTGAPAISLPLCTDSRGLPLGVQFIAPFGEDATVLELAYELEEAQPWAHRYTDG